MNDLLNNPAVQSGVVPFALGLVAALALARTRWLAAVPWLGFVAVVALALGFSFEPLTSLRKLVLAGLAGGVVALALDGARVPASRGLRLALAAAAAAAAVWVVARVLAQREGAAPWIAGAAVAVYAAALAFAPSRLAADPLRASTAATVLALATAALSLIGATASMTQLGIALGAASGALVLVLMLRGGRAAAGAFVALPVALACALIGPAVVLTGALAWPALLPLPFVALAALAVKRDPDRPAWRDALYAGLAALVPAALAVGIGWAGAAAAPA